MFMLAAVGICEGDPFGGPAAMRLDHYNGLTSTAARALCTLPFRPATAMCDGWL
jgi:hypothetical protein